MTTRTAVLALALVLIWPLCASAAESVPTRGMTMTQVKDRFGPPKRIRAPVGQPPITRWYYPGFTVYFERNLTLDAVMDRPPPTRTASTADKDGTVIAHSSGTAAPHASAPFQRGHDTGKANRPDPEGNGKIAPQTPAPSYSNPKPADPPPASDNGEPSHRTNHAPASSAIRAERQQEEADSQFRFNPQSGRIEIVNDAKSAGGDEGKHTASGAPASAATDGHSTQPATNVSARTKGTNTVAQPKNAIDADSVKATK